MTKKLDTAFMWANTAVPNKRRLNARLKSTYNQTLLQNRRAVRIGQPPMADPGQSGKWNTANDNPEFDARGCMPCCDHGNAGDSAGARRGERHPWRFPGDGKRVSL